MTLTNAWLGAPTESSAVVVTKTSSSSQSRIRWSTSPDLSSPTLTTLVTPDAQNVARHTITGLAPNRTYYWGVDEGGSTVYTAGVLNTLPETGKAASFNFSFGSCWRNTTNETDTWTKITANAGRFFLQIGDLHYAAHNTADPSLWRGTYDTRLALPGFGAAAKSLPMYYVWDDLDFCGDNTTSAAAGAAAAQQAYRERVPYTTLPLAGTINQTFTTGRCRFILLDSRAARVQGSTMLGSAQLAWLQALLAAETLPLTFIVTPVGWIDANTGNIDDWGEFPAERATVAAAITASATKVIFLSGDMHKLAADDGGNSVGRIPIFHSAPMQSPNLETIKGGPYSQGIWPLDADDGVFEKRNYGRVAVTDIGNKIIVTYSGRDCVGGDVERISCTVVVPNSQEGFSMYGPTGATLANVTAAASSTQLFAANSDSVSSRAVFNDSTAVLYLKYGTAASTTSHVVQIPAGGYFEFPLPVYRGVVHGIWSAANGAARTTEVG